MKHLLLALIALSLLAGCASGPEPETETAIDHWVEYEVFGMDCPGCHGGLEDLALEIPGVVAARASWQDQELRLGVGPGAEVADAQIRAAIEKANFTAGERK